jgi:inosine-uridine nucleoside N-ribohydrolase
MSKNIGGRGHKSEYATKTKRIPIELESEIDKMIEKLYSGNQQIEILPFGYLTKLELAIIQANNILKQKKSATSSLTSFIRTLYSDQNITLRPPK